MSQSRSYKNIVSLSVLIEVDSFISVYFFSVFFSQLMTVRTVVVFHLIAAVTIIFFARARAVTLENVNLIVQV